MKTSDKKSRKRQALSLKITFWQEKIKILNRDILPDTKKIAFCQQEITSLKKHLLNLSAGTKAQRGAGWARGYNKDRI